MTTEILKQHKLGVDGTLQMAFQLGHYRLHGHNGWSRTRCRASSVESPVVFVSLCRLYVCSITPAATYESAATAGFKHGRTETIRSCTPERCGLTCVESGAETRRDKG